MFPLKKHHFCIVVVRLASNFTQSLDHDSPRTCKVGVFTAYCYNHQVLVIIKSYRHLDKFSQFFGSQNTLKVFLILKTQGTVWLLFNNHLTYLFMAKIAETIISNSFLLLKAQSTPKILKSCLVSIFKNKTKNEKSNFVVIARVRGKLRFFFFFGNN